MDLNITIMNVLGSTGAALTFEDVIEGVIQRLEPEIRNALNALHDEGRIERHLGGRNHPWRYRIKPINRRL